MSICQCRADIHGNTRWWFVAHILWSSEADLGAHPRWSAQGNIFWMAPRDRKTRTVATISGQFTNLDMASDSKVAWGTSKSCVKRQRQGNFRQLALAAMSLGHATLPPSQCSDSRSKPYFRPAQRSYKNKDNTRQPNIRPAQATFKFPDRKLWDLSAMKLALQDISTSNQCSNTGFNPGCTSWANPGSLVPGCSTADIAQCDRASITQATAQKPSTKRPLENIMGHSER
ncbi:unnamed protein product [Merluccius merluccius]